MIAAFFTGLAIVGGFLLLNFIAPVLLVFFIGLMFLADE